MKPEADTFLNQLVVGALTVFIAVILLPGALVLHQLWVQQRLADLSSDVQTNLDDLEEVTEGIQQELVEIRTTPGEAQDADNWEEIQDVLDDVDQQLESISENLNEVALAVEPQPDGTAALSGEEEQRGAIQDQVDRVFTIFAILVGAASILIAILLGMAVRVQQSLSEKGHHRFYGERGRS